MVNHLIKTSCCILFLTSIVFTSCKARKKSIKNENVVTIVDKKAQGFTKGVITKYDVDGCTYLIKLENGNMLIPLNLSEEFHENGLEVWFTYNIQKEAMTICMAGDAVNITAIERAAK